MSHREKPEGHVPVPLTIFAFVALFLGVATELLGIFRALNRVLREACTNGGLVFHSEMGLSDPVGILITAAAVFGLVGAILATPGGGRRAIVGLSGLFLTLALVPAFAVWGIYWNPFGPALAVFWGWLSSTIYARSHHMPCEGRIEPTAQKSLDPEESHGAENYQLHFDGKS